MATVDATATLDRQLSGLDALELAAPPRRRSAARLWSATWPKVLAVAFVVATWQVLWWLEIRPRPVFPSPGEVWASFVEDFSINIEAVGTTMQRAVVGYAIALLIGIVVGLAVARSRVLRAAIGSLVTGLQTMPSVAWFPMALLLFQLSEGAIYFVVVLGAAPSIANGLIHGVDHIQPVLLRAGRVLGARGVREMRHVVLPAALPSLVGGLKQGWAFSWRSLMAGELFVLIPGVTGLGQRLEFERQLSDAPSLYGVMIVVLLVGLVVDGLVFAKAEHAIRRRYGLIDAAAE
ncbi:MAG TPA: ABC transporter permease [Acidimicrobiia bacterium]|nr:ABC transporter permease [Acidimicrobiia bacterium]